MSQDMIVAPPSFMMNPEYAKEGTDLLNQYIKPARLKIVQATSSKQFLDLFGAGDSVAVPMNQLIAKFAKDGPAAFHFIPLLFYPEWICWNPLELRGMLNPIRERSLDPQSKIAAMARNFDRRNSEVCPEMPKKDNKDLFLRYNEHLNFVVVLLGKNELPDIPIVISFSSGEHKSGSNFAALIRTRQNAIYGNQFAGVVRHRTNAKGNWYGIDVENPKTESGVLPFVMDEAVFTKYREMHLKLRKAYEDQAIIVDHDDGDNFDGGAPDIKC